MSFFVSNSIKDIIDEKTYLSNENESDVKNYIVKSNDEILFSKKTFKEINFNKNSNIKSIDFFLSLNEVNKTLFKKNKKLEILNANSKKHTFLLKLLKIAKIDDDRYYCQYKVLGENHD